MINIFDAWLEEKKAEYAEYTGMRLEAVLDASTDIDNVIVEVITPTAPAHEYIIGRYETTEETKVAIKALVAQARIDKIERM